MIIREVSLRDFGVYGGEHTFDLAPGSQRPLVLISGKNGVGKTTLVEAIRLCLHGTLAVSTQNESRRVAQHEYDAYLLSRIHRPAGAAQENGDAPDAAQIALTLAYVDAGRRRLYRVERGWQRRNGRAAKTLSIWENGVELHDLDADQKESLLRELVPPGAAELFFFNGERIETIASAGGNGVLAETIETLLGLNLVEQLKKDLDVYISRQEAENSHGALQQRLRDLTTRQEELVARHAQLQARQEDVSATIADLHRRVIAQEQKIAGEGGWFAERRAEFKAREQHLEGERETQKRHVQELCNGLLPFAVAPEWAGRVAERLETERAYKRWQTAQQLVDAQTERLAAELAGADFWAGVGMDPDPLSQQILLKKIASSLQESVPPALIDAGDVILHASDQERGVLQGWIEQVLDEVPRRFTRALERLQALEEELEQVRAELAKVPADEILSPLVETLNDLNKELGIKEQEQTALAEQLEALVGEREEVEAEVRLVREKLAEQEAHGKRLRLAARTQLVLDDYAEALTREKVARLERLLARRFNALCRKQGFVDAAQVDPDTFQVTLLRAGEPFAREELSAGEQHLLAIATMWSLREVSGLPMPVIIDTPLGRLDSDHRLSTIRDYLPQAGHQVIVLATDAEIDRGMEATLAPAVSRIYRLGYDAARGRTTWQRDDPAGGNGQVVDLEGIQVR